MSTVEPALRALRHLQMRQPTSPPQALAALDDVAGLLRQLRATRDTIGLELASLNRTIVATRAYAPLPAGWRQKGTSK